MQSGQPEEPVSIEGPPPLARLAALMALLDLFWNRILVRTLGADHELGTALQRAGVFPRNLAAVAGLVALTAGLYGFLRMAGYAGLVRRLSISMVAGLLMPAFLLATLMPAERVSMLVVVVALAASNLLAVLLGTVALRYPAGLRRAAVVCATTSASLVLTGLVVASVRSIAASTAAPTLSTLAHHAGELAWHILPMFGLAALFRAQNGAPASEGAPPGRVVLALAGLIIVGILGGSLFAETALHAHRFGTLVYGALRLTLVPGTLAWLNGWTVGVALAASLLGLASRSPARIQLGAAIALWLAAGYAPRAPGQLLDLSLSVLLLARAAQAATPLGRERARMRWGPTA